MRLTDEQVAGIRDVVRAEVGEQAEIRLFGSRLDDARKGGDVDLFVEVPHAVTNPALLSARISARVGRLMYGRQVDVVLSAPNLRKAAIHDIARARGQKL